MTIKLYDRPWSELLRHYKCCLSHTEESRVALWRYLSYLSSGIQLVTTATAAW